MSEALAGVRVVVTRPPSTAEAFGRVLAARGAEPIYLPLIEIVDPASWEPLDRALQELEAGAYDWVAFTSANAVAKMLARASLRGLDLAGRAKIAAVGPATAQEVAGHGASCDLIPAEHSGAGLARELGEGRGRLLLPRAEDAPPALPQRLRAQGWAVDEVAAYRNVRPALDSAEAARVLSGDFDVIALFSGSAARNLAALVAEAAGCGLGPDDPPQRLLACIGPPTAAAARDAGLRVDVVAPEPSAEALLEAIRARLVADPAHELR